MSYKCDKERNEACIQRNKKARLAKSGGHGADAVADMAEVEMAADKAAEDVP